MSQSWCFCVIVSHFLVRFALYSLRVLSTICICVKKLWVLVKIAQRKLQTLSQFYRGASSGAHNSTILSRFSSSIFYTEYLLAGSSILA